MLQQWNNLLLILNNMVEDLKTIEANLTDSEKANRGYYRLRRMLADMGIIVTKRALQSYNFESLVDGWKISANGDVEFNNGTFRGSITASTIDIGGSDDQSFHVDADGNLWAGAATYALAPFKVSNTGTMIFNDGSYDRILVGYQLNGF